MESNGNFESGDYVEVFGQPPKENRIEPGTLRLIYLVGISTFVTVCLLFVMFLGTVAIFRDPCIKDHFSDKSGEFISFPQERDEKGCIKDFNHPLGYDK